MDEDARELIELLTNKIKQESRQDSKLTVGWAVIIGIMVAAMSFLLQGYISNARGITKLDAEVCANREAMKEFSKLQSIQNSTLMDLRLELQKCKQGQINAN